MADWFMEECMMLSDWTLGGRGGIWLPAAQGVGGKTARLDPRCEENSSALSSFTT